VFLSNKLRAAHTALADGCARHHAIGVFVVTDPMLLQFALSSLRKESYRLLSSCADGSRGLSTTPRRGNALGASPGGRRCQPSRTR
jgi:hypothetical protein